MKSMELLSRYKIDYVLRILAASHNVFGNSLFPNKQSLIAASIRNCQKISDMGRPLSPWI